MNIKGNEIVSPHIPKHDFWLDLCQLYPRYVEERSHLQFQNTTTLGNNRDLKLTLSYRMDRVESTGNTREKNTWRNAWGMALIKDINENFSFRSTYGTFNRFPHFTESFGDGVSVLPTFAHDAKHCQKETCKKIIEKGGNYVFGLKENQKNLYKDVELFLSDKNSINEMEIFITTKKSHGRIEKNFCYKILNIDWISMKKNGLDLAMYLL